MAPKSVLSVSKWPTNNLNCVSWSVDSEIVVVCEEELEIFIPKLSFNSPISVGDADDFPSWHKVRLQVNLFTTRELPLLEPAHFSIYSIGEEQSTGNITAATWSPPCLGKYQRCVLGVLTSNLVLSIWASDGNRTTADSWKRVCIVNDCLQNLNAFFPINRSGHNLKAPAGLDRSRIRSRVRSFSWSPPLPSHYSQFANLESSRASDCDLSYIAVTNDHCDIVICRVLSPSTNVLGAPAEWDVQPALLLSLNSLPAPENEGGYTTPFIAQNIATYLAWSPWVRHPISNAQSYKSCVAFVANSNVYLKELVLEIHDSEAELKFGAEIICLDHPRSSLIRWAYHPTKIDTLLLCSAGLHLVSSEVRFTEHGEGIEISNVFSSQDIFSWNRPAGLAYGVTSEQTSMFIAKESSVNGTAPLYFDLPLGNGNPSVSAPWASLAQNLQDGFAEATRTFPLETTFKFWGLDSNLTNDCMAICVSAHPKDVLEYSTFSERQFSLFLEDAPAATPAYILTSSAESMCFSLTRFVKQRLEISTLDQSSFELFFKHEEAASSSMLRFKNRLEPAFPFETLRDAVSYIKHTFQPYRIFLPRLYQYLSKRQEASLQSVASEPPLEIQSLFLLIFAISKLPQDLLHGSAISNLILQNYHKAAILITHTWKAHLKAYIEGTFLYTLDIYGDGIPESCEICSSTIPFEDILWAQCEEGHQYVRCALTLLAIQIPGCSKVCYLCGRRYFADEYLLHRERDSSIDVDHIPGSSRDRIEPGPENVPSSRASLIGILLAGCATCILCGGKFTFA